MLIIKKKLFLYISSLLLAFATIVAIPQQEVKANPLALAAGVEVGAGVYVTAALLVAGGAGLVGYEEHGDAIRDHAQQVWSGANQVVKDSMRVSFEAAIGAGNKTVALSNEYLNYMDGQVSTIAGFLAGLKYADPTGKTLIQKSANGVTYDFTNSKYTLYFTTTVGGSSKIWGGESRRINVYKDGIEACSGSSGCAGFGATIPNPEAVIARLQSATSLAAIASIWNSVSKGWGMTVDSADPVYNDIYSQAVSKTREQWESMRDAGLVIPVDSAIPHANGKQAVYNPTDGTYTGVDGGVINPSDVTWSFPVPKYRDTDVPVPGVYVDTPPLTGVPSIDESITKNPAIPKDTTNVNTGVTIKNPDVPAEYNPPTTGGGTPTTPGEGTTPKGINFKPLIFVGTLLTQKFPFSIPWDFFKMLGQFNVEPKTPVFKIDSGKGINLGGKHIFVDYEFELDFGFLDTLAKIARWALILVFDITLILGLRRLTPD